MASELISHKNTNNALMVYSPESSGLLPCFKKSVRKIKITYLEKEIKIIQDWDRYGVSAVVWEAAIELGHFMSKNMELAGKRIIELGAGTGLVGMVAAKLGANVTFTDLLTALPLLKKNLQENFEQTGKNITIRELEWGKNLKQFKEKNFDYIIGADIVYIEDSFQDLLKTLIFLANRNDEKKAKIILSCKLRYEREINFINILKKFATVNQIYFNANNRIAVFEAVIL